MNEDQDLEALRKVLSDEGIQPLNISIRLAWVVFSSLQLAHRHPEISPMLKGHIHQIGRQFQDAIVALHPDIASLAEKGWQPQNDWIKPRRHGFHKKGKQ